MYTLKTIFYIIMRIFNYIIGFVGVFGALGFVGGLEHNQITFGQFWLYEFLCACLIVLTIIVYNIRETYKYRYLRN